jgi:transposase
MDLAGSIVELEKLIEAESPKLPGLENLMSIKRMGAVSAADLLSAIGKIEDFDDPDKLAA